MSRSYAAYLAEKRQADEQDGFEPLWMPDFLFDFQKMLTGFSIETGRTALLADCGLGKTPMQLVTAENFHRKTNKPVLILAPLAVGPQTVREGEKFGLEVRRTNDGTVHKGLNVTNYERLHLYNPDDFGGLIGDESSAIKHFKGHRQRTVTEFMRKVRYRQLCSATAAPNDHVEFGTSSEALGYLGYMDMLSTFFKTDEDSLHPTSFGAKFKFKAHAEDRFWAWLSSWARAIRKPSDFGFEDRGYVLPELVTVQHVVDNYDPLNGSLFALGAQTLHEQRQERRNTLADRCEKVSELLSHDRPAVAWCHLNEEGDLLEKLIPGAVQVSGSDSDEHKERAFLGFADGSIRVLVTKPEIGGFGLNWQHAADMTMFPSHSFERYYQAVRRMWRFGQTKPVNLHMVTTQGESQVLANLERKSAMADEMFARLIAHQNDALRLDRSRVFSAPAEIPSWL